MALIHVLGGVLAEQAAGQVVRWIDAATTWQSSADAEENIQVGDKVYYRQLLPAELENPIGLVVAATDSEQMVFGEITDAYGAYVVLNGKNFLRHMVRGRVLMKVRAGASVEQEKAYA